MLKEWFFGREVKLPKPLSQLSPASPAHEVSCVRTLLYDYHYKIDKTVFVLTRANMSWR